MPQLDPYAEPADLVLRGGVVHTMAATTSSTSKPATAVAVRAGRVLAVGDDEQVLGTATPATEVIDLAGRGVLPGINDAHLHATWLGALWPRIELGFTGSEHSTPPLRTAGDRRAAVLHAGDVLASLGVTSYTEPGIGPGEDGGHTGAFGSSVAEVYRELAADGLLRARVTVLTLFGELDGPSDLDTFLAGLATMETATPDPEHLRFAGVKIFADGIPPMRTAYTNDPYPGGHRASLLVAGGDDTEREANFAKMVVAAHRAGLQVGVHATGDRSIELMLNALRDAGGDRDCGLGHYVIHGDLVGRRQLARMARMGVGLSAQAGIAVHTHALAADALGADRATSAWPLATAIDAGVPVCLTSDAPILSPDWRRQVAAADEWMGPATDPRERTLALLRCYTVNPAHQDGAARWKGRLAPGMAADLCVLAADPVEVTPAELPDIDVDVTITAGTIVHDRSHVSS